MMPLTPEERTRGSRETGERAATLADLLPPDETVTGLEDRREFVALARELMSQYQPVNQLAQSVVLDIATATWQIRRYRFLITAQWNLAAYNEATKPSSLAPELHELSVITGAARALHTGDKLALVYNREIASLQRSIAALERRLKFIHTNFAAQAAEREGRPEDAWLQPEERTQPESPQPVENKEPEPAEPITIYNDDPDVVAAYRLVFPDREIIVKPPDSKPRAA